MFWGGRSPLRQSLKLFTTFSCIPHRGTRATADQWAGQAEDRATAGGSIHTTAAACRRTGPAQPHLGGGRRCFRPPGRSRPAIQLGPGLGREVPQAPRGWRPLAPEVPCAANAQRRAASEWHRPARALPKCRTRGRSNQRPRLWRFSFVDTHESA